MCGQNNTPPFHYKKELDNMMNKKYTRIGYHILFWSVYLALNGLLACVMENKPIVLDNWWHLMKREAFSLPAKLLQTYFIFYQIIPLYLDRSKFKTLVSMTLLSFVVATILYRVSVNWYFITYEHYNSGYFEPIGMILAVFDLYITITSATIIKMIKMRYKSQEFEEQLIQEKLQSELNFLRTQTNPHFLFNTLNNLYVLARKQSEKTSGAIMMLSKIMRFVLYDCRAHQISLVDEAKVIQDYIELEKLRYNDRLNVVYEEDLDQLHAQVAPLMMLPFVENSFKHGAHSTTGKVEIHISLSLKDKHLTFIVENTVGSEKETPAAVGSSGIGLKNVQRQLDLIYPNRYSLVNGRVDGGIYRAKLEIELD